MPVGIVYIVAKYVKTPAGICSMIQESITDLGYEVHRVCNISISR